MSKPLKPAQVKQLEAIQTARLAATFDAPLTAKIAEFKRASAADDEISPWVNPSAMSESERAALVARIEAGEVFSLRFMQVSFGDGGNRNSYELSAKHIKQMAKSAGRIHQNLLDGHGSMFGGSAASSIVGEILKGWAVKQESGETQLVLAQRIADVRGMVQFARGLWRTSSVAMESSTGWDYTWLDRDGNKTDDFWSAESYRVHPREGAEIGLVHNAFVADPAYTGTGTIQPFGARPIGEILAMADKDKTGSEGKDKGAQDQAAAEVVRLSAALALAERDRDAARAELATAQGELKAERDAHFRSVFDHAVREGKATPAEEALYSTFAQSQGVSKAAEMLAARKPVVPMHAVGLTPAQTPPAPVGGERAQGSNKEPERFANEGDMVEMSVGTKPAPKK